MYKRYRVNSISLKNLNLGEMKLILYNLQPISHNLMKCGPIIIQEVLNIILFLNRVENYSYVPTSIYFTLTRFLLCDEPRVVEEKKGER